MKCTMYIQYTNSKRTYRFLEQKPDWKKKLWYELGSELKNSIMPIIESNSINIIKNLFF